MQMRMRAGIGTRPRSDGVEVEIEVDSGRDELRVVEARVRTVVSQQLAVRAFLDDPTVLHHEDDVGAADGRQAVRDHEAGAVLAQRFMASWMSTSVRVSTELVASSRIRIDRSARKA